MLELAGVRLARASRAWMSDPAVGARATAYVHALRDRGYAPLTIRLYLESLAHFAHWCTQRRIALTAIDRPVVERFLHRHLPRCRCAPRCQRRRHTVRAGLTQFLRFLRREGRIGPAQPSDPAPIRGELRRFHQYLTQVCGLRPTTCAARGKYVQALLRMHWATGGNPHTKLTPAEVARFVAVYTDGWAPASQRVVGDGLRSYFRFRALRGEHSAALVAAIPRVAHWRAARLPRGLRATEVARLLAAVDRTSATRHRDYAIVRCLVDLGLRATEVARLSLTDIDWRRGRVTVRGKAHRVDLLPLPAATGRAIATYLREGRPPTQCRALFLRHRPPRETPATVEMVRGAVRRAAQRGAVAPCLNGPRILRHTLAEHLVLRGTPLKQIADLLRHRSLDTTTIYAKVDLPALRRVALPWPGRRP